jgi:hypothetical protein
VAKVTEVQQAPGGGAARPDTINERIGAIDTAALV